MTAVVSAGVGVIGFRWGWPPVPYDGVSVLVNDVERGRWYIGEGNGTFRWNGVGEEAERREKKEYFRFAYMMGSSAADYTKAGVWDGDSWRRGEEEPGEDS